jgi:hypothetical protein
MKGKVDYTLKVEGYVDFFFNFYTIFIFWLHATPHLKK